jgi:hypothetical protein
MKLDWPPVTLLSLETPTLANASSFPVAAGAQVGGKYHWMQALRSLVAANPSAINVIE